MYLIIIPFHIRFRFKQANYFDPKFKGIYLVASAKKYVSSFLGKIIYLA